jgi:hypothetical protein
MSALTSLAKRHFCRCLKNKNNKNASATAWLASTKETNKDIHYCDCIDGYYGLFYSPY